MCCWDSIQSRRNIFQRLLLLLVILLSQIIFSSCNQITRESTVPSATSPGVILYDSILMIKGKVFEWVNAADNATSQIFRSNSSGDFDTLIKNIVNEIPQEIEKSPLKDVAVLVSGGPAYLQVTSNASGDFGGEQWIYQQIDFGIKVTVQKEGYWPAVIEIPGGDFTPVLVAILVRDQD
jgi:hypothetical protein